MEPLIVKESYDVKSCGCGSSVEVIDLPSLHIVLHDTLQEGETF